MDFFIAMFSLAFYAVFGVVCFSLIRIASRGHARRSPITRGKPILIHATAARQPALLTDALREGLMLRLIDSPNAIDDMAHEILSLHPDAMVFRCSSIYKGAFPTYAIAIPDAGMGFDIRMVDFDPRNALAGIEQAVLKAAALDSTTTAPIVPNSHMRL